uniref:Oxysterol-binding protein n=1 Tax=Gasterosteus aculeatus aculeatus TaxID=481459 RepID=A0AAQ4Q6A3_GASAC
MEADALEATLLRCAKEGNCAEIQLLLESRTNRPSPGWTPLHLACFFGRGGAVEQLLKAGADANVQDHVGDTPLHKAAFTGRQEIVLLLLRYDACCSIINGVAQIPKDVTMDDEVITMLEAAETRETRRREKKLLEAAREGEIAALSKLLSGTEPPDIHCRDSVGNTPLHCAAYRGQKQCIIKLLKSGASPTTKNSNGVSTQSYIIRSDLCNMFAIIPFFYSASLDPGFLHYVMIYCTSSRLVRWRSHWVIIEDGTISWYPKQCFDDTVYYFKVSSKTDPALTRKRWLDALEAHSSFSAGHCPPEPACNDADDDVTVRNLSQALQVSLSPDLSNQVFEEVANGGNSVIELSSGTCAALHLCLELLSEQEEVWSLKFEQEVEKNRALTEALQTLATENHQVERSRGKSRRSSVLSTFNEDDFYDALSESDSELSVSGFLSVAGHSGEEDEGRDSPLLSSLRRPGALGGPAGMSGEGNHGNQHNGVEKHRTSLPTPMFSRNDVSIWGILKKCIGMELSKIAMPVIFNEPLSFLQRLTEYMEHTYLIHKANATTDSVERMKCVAAFAVSAVASQWERTGKPFNPLLGETYELIREDLGFRWVSEQVSHHPPVSAFHAEGLNQDFVFHGSIYPKLKFWGKSIEAEPKGLITLELPRYNEAYTWTNPTCCVHNIIVGQLWIEQYGSMEVINHKTGERCSMMFKPCGLFGKELHKVEGYIQDKSKKKLCAIYGKWTESLYAVDPVTFDSHKKTDKKSSDERKDNKRGSVDEEPEEMPPPDAETVPVVPGSELIWKITPRPGNSAQFYAFSTFAMHLNEQDKSTEEVAPATDSRFRPDIRAMENGDIDFASSEKKRLEEKQRMARKNRSKSPAEWKTRLVSWSGGPGSRWFEQGQNPHNKAQDWIYLKGYWERNYTDLPDIY